MYIFSTPLSYVSPLTFCVVYLPISLSSRRNEKERKWKYGRRGACTERKSRNLNVFASKRKKALCSLFAQWSPHPTPPWSYHLCRCHTNIIEDPLRIPLELEHKRGGSAGDLKGISYSVTPALGVEGAKDRPSKRAPSKDFEKVCDAWEEEHFHWNKESHSDVLCNNILRVPSPHQSISSFHRLK